MVVIVGQQWNILISLNCAPKNGKNGKSCHEYFTMIFKKFKDKGQGTQPHIGCEQASEGSKICFQMISI
jgi:hypothetical protein